MATTCIVGGGIFGLSAALALAERGVTGITVCALDVYEPEASALAASNDENKLCRPDYGADAALTRLHEAAIAGWRHWNAHVFARPLFHPTGVLIVAAADAGRESFERQSFRVLAERGHHPRPLRLSDGVPTVQTVPERTLPAWRLSAAECNRSYLSQRAGWVEAGAVCRGLRAHIQAKFPHAVTFRDGAEVAQVHAHGVVEFAGRGREQFSRVVLAAGAWTPSLARAARLPLRPTAQYLAYYEAPIGLQFDSAQSFPPFAYNIAETGIYGFPRSAQSHQWKLGLHYEGSPSSPPSRAAEVDAAALDATLRPFLRAKLRNGDKWVLKRTKVCWYCDREGGDFLLGPVKGVPGLFVASGGSGHGFKFGPVLGDILAEAMLGPGPRHAELAEFVKRFSLDAHRSGSRMEAARKPSAGPFAKL